MIKMRNECESLTRRISHEGDAVDDLDVAGSSCSVKNTDGLDEDAAEEFIVLIETVQVLRGSSSGSSDDTRGEEHQCQQLVHLSSSPLTWT